MNITKKGIHGLHKMSENYLYDRQKNMELVTDLSLTIVGCGGIGFWTALFCAMSGVNEMFLYDPDKIELSNLNRLSLPETFIHKNKAETAMAYIKTIRPYCNIKAFNLMYGSMFAYKCDCVIDCTDSISSQIKNQEISKNLNARYMKLGYDGEHITIANNVARWGDIGDDEAGYITTPSWVVPSVIIAALGVAKVLKYYDKEISCEIKDLYNNNQMYMKLDTSLRDISGKGIIESKTGNVL